MEENDNLIQQVQEKLNEVKEMEQTPIEGDTDNQAYLQVINHNNIMENINNHRYLIFTHPLWNLSKPDFYPIELKNTISELKSQKKYTDITEKSFMDLWSFKNNQKQFFDKFIF